MRGLTVITAAVAVLAFTACKKTGEGEYEVQKPVVGTVTDTVNTPSVDVHMDTEKVVVPNVDVKSPSENKR